MNAFWTLELGWFMALIGSFLAPHGSGWRTLFSMISLICALSAMTIALKGLHKR
jgi:hypothetical protein